MTESRTKHLPVNAQPGVSEKPREHLLLAALAFSPGDPAACRAALESLRRLVAEELHGRPAAPDTETGELGYQSDHETYGLLVTLGLSTSGYDRLGAGSQERPVDLQPIPGDVTDPTGQGRGPELPGEGDVLLHIASDDVFVAEHVLRRVEHELGDRFGVVWAQTGVQRWNTRQAKDARKESRALNGFLDGTSNLTLSDPEHRALVFTNHRRDDYPPNPTADQYAGAQFPVLRPPPALPEPAALDGGTYMAVEVLLTDTAAFDGHPVAEQEQAVGRHKVDGTPMVPADPRSHVQKANPDRPGTDDRMRRVLRRGYALLRPHGGRLARGLVFVAFGRSLSTQAEFVRRAWINNPNFPTQGAGQDALLFGDGADPRLLAGGYYFVPPLAKPSDRTSWVLPGTIA